MFKIFNKHSSILLTMLLFGCQPKVSPPISPLISTPQSPIPEVSELNKAQGVLEAYFDSVIKLGDDGDKYWCSESKSLQKSLFSPRSYKILSSQKMGTSKEPAFQFHTSVESSNQGGSSIIVNWNFSLIQSGKDWCIAYLGS